MLYIEYNRRSETSKKTDAIKVYVPGQRNAQLDKRSLSTILWHYREYEHIVIVSGLMSGRGISFVAVSEDGMTYGRHLTSQYFTTGGRKPMDNIIQQALRLLGVYTDHPELTLYCSQDIYDHIFYEKEMIDQYLKFMLNSKIPISASRVNEIIKLAESNFRMRRSSTAERKIKNAPVQRLSQHTSIEEFYDTNRTVSKLITSIYDRHIKFEIAGEFQPKALAVVGAISAKVKKAIDAGLLTKVTSRYYDVWKKTGHSAAPHLNEIQIVWRFRDEAHNVIFRAKKGKTTLPLKNVKLDVVLMCYNTGVKAGKTKFIVNTIHRKKHTRAHDWPRRPIRAQVSAA